MVVLALFLPAIFAFVKFGIVVVLSALVACKSWVDELLFMKLVSLRVHHNSTPCTHTPAMDVQDICKSWIWLQL